MPKVRDVDEWMRLVMEYAQAVPGLQARVHELNGRVHRLEAVNVALENALFAANGDSPKRGPRKTAADNLTLVWPASAGRKKTKR